jgi:uncharacterized protein (DUF362 family)
VPLVNLHTGDLVDVNVPGAFVFDKLTIHRSLVETDLLCSVPMMKTHGLARVTLGMKNLVGVYPGAVYQSVRGRMHDAAAKVEPSGTAAAIVDMVRANKLGLVVVDGSTAFQAAAPHGVGHASACHPSAARTRRVTNPPQVANLPHNFCRIPVRGKTKWH